jgi:hypothetical protein
MKRIHYKFMLTTAGGGMKRGRLVATNVITSK